ncbi:MAG: hypothetical protein KatS3mg001_423 [Candidatus Pacearchaeota archaeon]|nr:MAG: hypothetical protein KatS3mg001_423 [Candidatus Pacearchaeota archaeon]
MTMKSIKFFNAFLLSVILVVFLVSFIAADVNFVEVSGATQTVSEGKTATITFKLSETGTDDVNLTLNVPTLSNGSNQISGSASVSSVSLLKGNQSIVITLTYSVPLGQAPGVYLGNLTLSNTSLYSDSLDSLLITLTVTENHPSEILSCQSIGNPGNLRVRRIDFSNNGIQGSVFGDDEEWFPFENIEAEIIFENNGKENVDDIELNWGLWDVRNSQWVLEPEKIKEFNLKDGDEGTFIVNFTLNDRMDVDLEDLRDGKNYRFYVFGEGTIDNSSSPKTCGFDKRDVSIVIESDFVVLDNIKVPETVQCSQTVSVSADVLNVGDRDQEDVSVRVFERDGVLGLNKVFAVGDIDAFDKVPLSFTFNVPDSLDEKFYLLTFEVYDEDNDLYESSFDDDPSSFAVPIKVEGNCGIEKRVQISASLESEAVAGKDLVVKVSFLNTGKNLETLRLNVTGFESFAESVSLDRDSLVLGASQSQDVLMTFKVKNDASGTYTFFVEGLSSAGQKMTQPISVTIEGRKAGITGAFAGISEAGWFTWAIGILNIILIIIIIVVAIRLTRK